jgi:hypothetical protein
MGESVDERSADSGYRKDDIGRKNAPLRLIVEHVLDSHARASRYSS